MGNRRILDASLGGQHIKRYQSLLDQRITGQLRAKELILKILLRKDAGVNAADKPLGIIALFGPSGVGKTEMIKTLAWILFGDPLALTIIEGQNFQEEHTLSTLLGAPPGYRGSYDPRDGQQAPVLLSQASIDGPGQRAFSAKVDRLEAEIAELESRASSGDTGQQQVCQARVAVLRQEIAEVKSLLQGVIPSIVLFDEAEKMHPRVLQVLLSILNDGRVTLRSTQITDFTKTVICLTGNVAERGLSKMACDTAMGFHSPNSNKGKRDKNKAAFALVMSALNKLLGPTLVGRIGPKNIAVCQQLTYDEMMNILNTRAIAELLDKLAKHPKKVELVIDEAVKKLIANECFRNPDLGARALSNLVDAWIMGPLTFIFAKGEDEGGIAVGSKVFAVLDESTQKIIFECEE